MKVYNAVLTKKINVKGTAEEIKELKSEGWTVEDISEHSPVVFETDCLTVLEREGGYVFEARTQRRDGVWIGEPTLRELYLALKSRFA